jgi:hypothetical protein
VRFGRGFPLSTQWRVRQLSQPGIVTPGPLTLTLTATALTLEVSPQFATPSPRLMTLTATALTIVQAEFQDWPNVVVKIDWDDDGTFVDAFEDVSADVLEMSVSCGRERATDDFGAGTASIVLDNYEGTYNPFDDSGPLAGQIVPGREAILEWEYDGVTRPLFRGRITDVNQQREAGNRPAIGITFADAFEELRRGEIRLELQKGKRVDELIDIILDAAGWPVGRRDLAEASTILPYYWAHRISPLDALREVVRQEPMGNLYVDRDGDIKFEGRLSRLTPAVYASLTDVEAVDLAVNNTDLVDAVELIRSGLRPTELLTPVFDLSPLPYLIQSGDNTIEGEFDSGADDVQEPVGETDYTVNTLPDGTGVDMTSFVTVSDFTVYGKGFNITLNNARPESLYLTLFQVQGRRIAPQNDDRRVVTAVVAPLVSGQPLVQEYAFLDDPYVLRAFGEYLAEYHGQRQIRPTVRPLIHTGPEMTNLIQATISHRIQLTNTTGLWPTDLSFDGFIERYSLTFIPNQDVAGEWVLLPPERPGYGPAQEFIIGSSTFGGSHVFTF